MRRAALVDAAVRAIRELGPGVSMDEMARAAGITKPILYRHFGDRAGLCRAIAEDKAEQLWRRLAPRLDPARPATRAGLEGALDTYLAFCDEDEAVHRFLVAQRGRAGGGASSEPGDFGGRIAGLVVEGIRRRLAEAGADVSAAEPWAHGMVGMVTEAATWWLATRRITRGQLRDHLMTLIWNGFGGVPGTDRREEATR